MDEVMDRAESEAGVAKHEETWKRIGFALHTLITHKAADKTLLLRAKHS